MNLPFFACNYDKVATKEDKAENNIGPGLWYEAWEFCGCCKQPIKRIPGHFSGEPSVWRDHYDGEPSLGELINRSTRPKEV